MGNDRHSFVRHDLLELAAAYAEYSVFVTTAELDMPGPLILYVNSAFTRMTGYSVSELLGATPRILQGPRTDKDVLRRLRETLSSGNDFVARAINYKRDGTPFELEWIITHLRDSSGRTTHYIALQRDITGQERAEAELGHFDEELRQASSRFVDTLHELEAAEQRLIQSERLSAIEEMTAGVVHDISNALSPVFSLVQLLHSVHQLPEEAARYVSFLESSTQHALQLLESLKQFYRAGEATSVRTSVSLKTLLEGLPDLTRSRWWTHQRQTNGSISFAFDLGDVPDVSANATELSQVFVNLVINAIDAMPDGGTVSIRLRREGDHVVVVVSDSGVGIPDELMSRCFEPYVTSKPSGTGLGLVICRRIIQGHGGSIEVSQNSPQGTSFTVCLPLPVITTTPDSAVSAKVSARRILHIDDNTDRQMSLSEILRNLGHTVDVAHSGDEGLQRFYTSPYDVVIAGSGLQPTSGYDVAQAVKRTSPETRFAISLDASEDDIETNLPQFLQPDTIIRATAAADELEQTLQKLGLCVPD